MPTQTHDPSLLRRAVRAALDPLDRVVLAVSGGVDSMVLLDAATRGIPRNERDRIVIATFDHGTGDAAVAACALVEARCASLGVRCVAGCASTRCSTEAALRDARWSFLREVARAEGPSAATVCTAHTRDDQLETVLMRVLRGAGARGLAALYAASPIVRPLLGLGRVAVEAYARVRRLEWVEDPSNVSNRYFRNRVRHDLLPALRRVRPSIDEELLACSRSAAELRAELEAFVREHVGIRPLGDSGSRRGLDVAVASLAGFDADALAVLWPAIAARAGLALDRRGIAVLGAFSASTYGASGLRPGSRVQLAGGWTVARSRDAFQLRASSSEVAPITATSTTPGTATRPPVALSKEGVAYWRDAGGGGAEWSFRSSGGLEGTDLWSAWLPIDRPLWVRAWLPGDTMPWRGEGGQRKVKRFLTEARISGHERAAWPVVLSGDQIVWIPGVRRGAAASARSGRPGLAFICDYNDR